MSTVFKFKKHVSVVCDLSVGDKVTVSDWGYKLDGKECIIEDIKESFVGCSSGVLVKIDQYEYYIDSDWIDKT